MTERSQELQLAIQGKARQGKARQADGYLYGMATQTIHSRAQRSGQHNDSITTIVFWFSRYGSVPAALPCPDSPSLKPLKLLKPLSLTSTSYQPIAVSRALIAIHLPFSLFFPFRPSRLVSQVLDALPCCWARTGGGRMTAMTYPVLHPSSPVLAPSLHTRATLAMMTLIGRR